MSSRVSMAGWMWRRFLAAAGIIVLLTAGAVSSAAILSFNHVADLLAGGHRIKVPDLAQYRGGAETFLIFGSDHRAFEGKGANGNSDTQMLLRFDPDKGEMTMLSIPRDLKVDIPGHCGPCKINAAYAYGGPQLGLKTIERVLGPSVQVNHVIDTDFKGFRQAVDAIGGVYAQVDRRYFNDITGLGGYSAINIQPGYQRLNGSNALDYVRYRHTDTDLVREARQQDFIAQVRTQIGTSTLINNEEKLLSIFARATSSDIVGRSGAFFANLFLLVAGSIGKPIRQVPFRVTVGPSYVTATQSQIDATVNDFLNGTSTQTSAAKQVAPAGAAKRVQRTAGSSLQNAVKSGQDQAILANGSGFPIYYPRTISSDGNYDQTRTYTIPDTGGHHHRAYVMVIHAATDTGQYYDIQGTTWTDPPILAGPHDTLQIGGRTYHVYYVGKHIRTVALMLAHAVYWVQNTLLRKLSNNQMMAIATSLARCC
ncbi:MAG: LCP family protein [Solirubrobacteraceae bacterium]|nr:MAG: hypothetical protein DLM63_01210 [Solirubrobacterales bacterium]